MPGTAFGENVRYLGKKGLVFGKAGVRNAELGDLYETAKSLPGYKSIVLNHMGIVDPDTISVQTPSEGRRTASIRNAGYRNIRKAGIPLQCGMQDFRTELGKGSGLRENIEASS